MSVMVVRRDRHIPKETEIGRFFQRELKCPQMITLWDRTRDMWVLAHWLDPSQTIVEEIEDLGPNFEAVTRDFVSMIRAGWGVGIDWGSHKKRLLSRQKDKLNKQTEEIRESQEEWDWVKRQQRARGHNPLPYAVDVGTPSQQQVHTTMGE